MPIGTKFIFHAATPPVLMSAMSSSIAYGTYTLAASFTVTSNPATLSWVSERRQAWYILLILAFQSSSKIQIHIYTFHALTCMASQELPYSPLFAVTSAGN